MEKLQLKGIYIYPIKSIMGISLLEAQAGERGLKNDRRWMLVDEKNTFITQRKFHHLALIDLKLKEEQINACLSFAADREHRLRVAS